jgi:hypothetical protein
MRPARERREEEKKGRGGEECGRVIKEEMVRG